MKVLTISMMYPTRPRPSFGVFVKNRMVEVAKLIDDLVVVAPDVGSAKMARGFVKR